MYLGNLYEGGGGKRVLYNGCAPDVALLQGSSSACQIHKAGEKQGYVKQGALCTLVQRWSGLVVSLVADNSDT